MVPCGSGWYQDPLEPGSHTKAPQLESQGWIGYVLVQLLLFPSLLWLRLCHQALKPVWRLFLLCEGVLQLLEVGVGTDAGNFFWFPDSQSLVFIMSELGCAFCFSRGWFDVARPNAWFSQQPEQLKCN